MIWVRRAFTVPLMLLLIVVLFVVVFVTQVNDTVANPEFYNDRMTEADVYNFVYDDAIPAALEEVDESEDLPIGLSAIEREIVLTIKQTFPPDWLQAQFESLTGTLIPYFVGDSEHFTFTLMLEDRVETGGQAVEEYLLCCAAFHHIYDEVISYIAPEIYASLVLPPSVTITEPMIEGSLRSVVNESWMAAQIASALDAFIPYLTKDTSHFTISLSLAEAYTDADLLLLLGAGNEGYLDEAWDWIEGEWTFTDADLIGELDADGQKDLQDARNWVDTGYTVTDAELLEAIAGDGGDTEGFDNARRWVHTGRSLLWVMWILPVVLIAGIGFLGGRSWKGRAAWALGAFLFATIVVLVATVLLYSNVGKPRIAELQLDVNAYQGVAQLLAEKGNELIQHSFDSFIDGMRTKAVYVIIATGAGVVGVVAWYLVDARRRRTSRRPAEPTPGARMPS